MVCEGFFFYNIIAIILMRMTLVIIIQNKQKEPWSQILMPALNEKKLPNLKLLGYEHFN